MIKDWYDHELDPWSHEVCKRSPSIYVIFRKDWSIVYCESGNELRRLYLDHPEEFISEPLYLAVPRYLKAAMKARLDDLIDNF